MLNRLLFLLLLIYGTGCHTPGNESMGTKEMSPAKYPVPVSFDLAEIKKRGVLTAIVDNTSTGYFLYKGQPMGYEYDLLKLFATHIGVNLQVKLTTNIDHAFHMLNTGKGDIIAYSLTVTKERNKIVAFSDNHFTTRQVLVQRKPKGWRQMTRDQISNQLLRNQVDLIGKEVHIRKSSAYVERLHHLSEEIGGDIIIIEDENFSETEELIKKVAKGDIDYTVADESVALVNAAYYSNIDVRTPISFPQQISWGMRKNAPVLLQEVNKWLAIIKKEPTFNVIYKKYYQSPRAASMRVKSDYSSMGGEKISIYDDIIKAGADSLGWDWRLLASQIYQESRFNPDARSWAGAIGLMQVLPGTGEMYGTEDLLDPAQNIAAGVRYLSFLDKLWSRTIKDKKERIKFVLASYNVGLGHVVDARELAGKYDKDPLIWSDNVEYFLLMKSKPEFFRDPIVTSGYCRGEEPVNYVRDILSRYEQYVQLLKG